MHATISMYILAVSVYIEMKIKTYCMESLFHAPTLKMHVHCYAIKNVYCCQKAFFFDRMEGYRKSFKH